MRTFRVAHLERKAPVAVGQVVRTGDHIGTMGNTGQSTGAHVHCDCFFGKLFELPRLKSVDPNCADPAYIFPDVKQLNYFMDREISGGIPLRITTFYMDPRYRNPDTGELKQHPAYDFVIDSPKHNYDLYWNRTPEGVVTFNGFDRWYGWTVMIAYDEEF